MMTKTIKKYFSIIVIILLVGFIVAKYLAPAVIHNFYKNQQSQLINTESLGRYQGHAQEWFLGPIASICSGILLHPHPNLNEAS